MRTLLFVGSIAAMLSCGGPVALAETYQLATNETVHGCLSSDALSQLGTAMFDADYTKAIAGIANMERSGDCPELGPFTQNQINGYTTQLVPVEHNPFFSRLAIIQWHFINRTQLYYSVLLGTDNEWVDAPAGVMQARTVAGIADFFGNLFNKSRK
jgi:hypothetical protein